MADITGTPEGETLDGTADADLIDGLGGDDTLNGLGGDDVIFGGAGDDTLDGGAGDDTLDGGLGSDAVTGGAGDDRIISDFDNEEIDGGDGTDTVEVASIEALDLGLAILDGDPQDAIEVILADNGFTSTLTDVERIERVNPLSLSLEQVVLLGTAGADQLDASSETAGVTIVAGDGDDDLIGSDFDDELYAGAGDNLLDGGLGDDILIADLNGTQDMDGGDGTDVVVVENFAAESNPLSVTVTDAAVSSAAGTTTYQNAEAVVVAGPTDGDDTVDASATTDALEGVSLLGDAGNDVLIGGGALTALWGGAGTDDMTAGSGQTTFVFGSVVDDMAGDTLNNFKTGDSLFFFQVETDEVFGTIEMDFIGTAAFSGRAGEVRYRFDGTDTRVEIDTTGDGNVNHDLRITGQDIDLQVDGATPVPFTGLALVARDDQTLSGTPGNDAIAGGDGNDTIDGLAGSDEIIGGAGDDTLFGGDGDDLLSGEAGDDVLLGGAGDDALRGGIGNNVLEGGAGNDLFVVGDRTIPDISLNAVDGGPGSDTLQLPSARQVFFDFTGPASTSGPVTITSDASLTAVTFENIERFERVDPSDGTTVQQVALFGTDGNDTIDASGEGQGVEIAGFGGDDTLTGSAFADTLQGAGGDDVLTGNAGGDTFIETLTGENLVDGGEGTDEVRFVSIGPADNRDTEVVITDTEVVAAPLGGRTALTDVETVFISAVGAGDDTLDASGASLDTVLQGAGGVDEIFGGAGMNFIRGGTGADAIVGGSGTNRIEIVGVGAEMDGDTVSGLGIGDVIDLFNPDLASGQVYFYLGEAAFSGQAGDIRLVRGANETRLEADLDGDRTADSVMRFTDGDIAFSLVIEDVEGIALEVIAITPGDPGVGPDPDPIPDPGPGPGPDPGPDPVPDPGPTPDPTPGSTPGDRIEGDDTPDVIRGTFGDDVLLGRGGNDDLRGSSGNDTVNGEAGDDFLAGGTGADTLLGGFGDDELNGGRDSDTLDGGAGNDVLLGGGGNDTLNAGDDNDRIQGGRGVDIIDAGRGDDTVLAGADNDVIIGGFGNDFLAGASGDDIIDGGGGNDTLNGAVGDDTLEGGFGNDLLNGGSGADALLGGNGADVVRGQGGADVVSGGAGNDEVFGGGGNDAIAGDDGVDIVFAGGGNDTIFIANGRDTVRGQGGTDTFVIDGTGSGFHVVKDFKAGETVELENFDFSGLEAATDAFRQSNNSVVFRASSTGEDDGAVMNVEFENADINDVLEGLALVNSPPPLLADAKTGSVGVTRAEPPSQAPAGEMDLEAAFVFEPDDFTDIA